MLFLTQGRNVRSRITVMCLLLSGCGATRPAVALGPPSGTTSSDLAIACASSCDTEWRRAEDWVTKHALLRVAVVDDTLIQTAPQPRQYPIYHFAVSRPAASQSASGIRLLLVCGNRLGCRPSAEIVRGAFQQYVVSGVDSLPSQSRFAGIR